MENAGLVTFTETSMLFDQHHPSWIKRSRWVTYAAHELAHQWFGDYVTMAYWDDIWLNEGFANWMELKITARFEPAWHDELSVLDMRNAALRADSVVSARQIRQPIEKPDDILNVFDGITYDKGASVLNMFESYLGADVFQRGVRDYLTSRAYGTATSTDFVAAISKAAGKDLEPGFATFLDQPGEPELEAQLKCGAKPPEISFVQRRYVPPGSPAPPTTKPWILPVCVVYEREGKRADQCTLVEGANRLVLATKKCPRWVMPNANGGGYYRTYYTAPQVVALRDEAWPLLTGTERRAVYFDVAQAARFRRSGMHDATATQLPLTLPLSLVPKMLTGGDRFSVGDALALPVGLDRIVPDELRLKYESWLRTTFSPGAVKLGLTPKDTDDLDAEINRNEIVYAAAWSGRDPDLIKQATELARSWRDLPEAIRGTVLDIAVDASPELFDKIKHDVKSEPDRQRRELMFHALAVVRDPKRFASALELVLDPAVDFREAMDMLFETSTEPTRAVAETYVRDHKDELFKRMPHDEVSGGVWNITALFTGACDATRRDAIADYVTKNFGTLPGGARVVQQGIEVMDQCIASRKILEPEVRAWLGGVKIPKPKDIPKKP
ncbi:MAG: Peptidase, partial [Myxococcales bacterium]|nr:Peptidase [Myxococcales bacterium]